MMTGWSQFELLDGDCSKAQMVCQRGEVWLLRVKEERRRKRRRKLGDRHKLNGS